MKRFSVFRLLNIYALLFLAFSSGTASLYADQLSDCAMIKNVRKDGAGDFISIQAAVDYLQANNNPLSTTTCVVIRDTQTYAEQVTVQTSG